MRVVQRVNSLRAGIAAVTRIQQADSDRRGLSPPARRGGPLSIRGCRRAGAPARRRTQSALAAAALHGRPLDQCTWFGSGGRPSAHRPTIPRKRDFAMPLSFSRVLGRVRLWLRQAFDARSVDHDLRPGRFAFAPGAHVVRVARGAEEYGLHLRLDQCRRLRRPSAPPVCRHARAAAAGQVPDAGLALPGGETAAVANQLAGPSQAGAAAGRGRRASPADASAQRQSGP